MATPLKGLISVIRNLNREIKNIEGRSLQGLIEAARLVREDMDTTSPVIPVGITGNLRLSYFTKPYHVTEKVPAIELGFGADYAVAVHEMVGAHFKRPGAGAKFFEAALKRNHKKIIETIRRYAKIK